MDEMMTFTTNAAQPMTVRLPYALPIGQASLGGSYGPAHDMAVYNRLSTLEGMLTGVAEAAHDLRHSLAIIRSAAQLLTSSTNAEDAYYAGMINDETTHLSRFLTDLLELSRLELNEVRLERSPLNLGEIITQSRKRAKTLFPRRSIHVRIPKNLPQVLGDTVRIGEVFMNLLTNADRYSPPGDPITVVVRVAGDPAERICIDVQDTGPGIAQETRAHLFEPFCTEASHVSPASGAGLGLAICKRIMTAHGGDISVAGNDGTGSTFTFWLPCKG